MQTEKLMFVAPHPTYPNLFARVTRTAHTEFQVAVWYERKDSRFGAMSLPRFTTPIDPTLYVHPSEVMQFLQSYALDQVDRAFTHLVGQGEWF
jgi:hypothetical protein